MCQFDRRRIGHDSPILVHVGLAVFQEERREAAVRGGSREGRRGCQAALNDVLYRLVAVIVVTVGSVVV